MIFPRFMRGYVTTAAEGEQETNGVKKAFAIATAILATGAAIAQANPPQASRSEQQPSASVPMTVPSAQQPPQQQQRERPRPPEQSQGEGAQRHAPAPEEKTSVTHHSARIGGQQISYTATAATYVIRADDGSPKATMFYVAYTRDGVQDVSKRPVSFVY